MREHRACNHVGVDFAETLRRSLFFEFQRHHQVSYIELAATQHTIRYLGLLEPGYPHRFCGVYLLTTKVAEDIQAWQTR
jgi:hypothetical protein